VLHHLRAANQCGYGSSVLQFFSKYPAMGVTLYCWTVIA